MRKSSIRSLLRWMLWTCCLVALMGCDGLLGGVGDGTQIVSVQITPDTIAESSTGMTDQFFTVTIETSGFIEDIADAEVFIQQNDRVGQPGNVQINGSTIVLEQIAQSWFSGLGAGVYPIGARVSSVDDIESVTQNSVATITVTE